MQRLPALYVLRQFSQRARSMHDVAWYNAMNYVRSRDAQKQLARTSLKRAELATTVDRSSESYEKDLHSLYLSRIEIPSLVGNFDLKTLSQSYPEAGNFELKSYPNWEVWPQIFVSDQSPHPIPWSPPPPTPE